jgi:hypothetical protein
MLTGLVIFSGVGTMCGGIIFQWRRSAANRKADMFKVRKPAWPPPISTAA